MDQNVSQASLLPKAFPSIDQLFIESWLSLKDAFVQLFILDILYLFGCFLLILGLGAFFFILFALLAEPLIYHLLIHFFF